LRACSLIYTSSFQKVTGWWIEFVDLT
jgi:hypothetical protein